MTADTLTAAEVALLEDPFWRLTSGKLYKIKTADGQGVIHFQPRPEQKVLLRELIDAVDAVKLKSPGWQKVQKKMKLKARRLGWSTTIGVFVADCLCFRQSFTATLIDRTGDDSTKKMNGIVKVAVNAALELMPLRKLKDNDSELTIDTLDPKQSAPSTFYAGTSARGGSNDFLWLSEVAVIQFDDPKRAEEIVTGALPSARHGVTVGETTWKGGKGGKVYQLIKPTLEGTADDWQVDFSPWWQDPRNVAPHASHDAQSLAYFMGIQERLDRDGIALSDEQKRWWAQERRTQGIFMMRENPTFLDECWRAPIEGAIYAPAIDRARTEGRICQMPVAGDSLVHTSWDLGSPRHTAIWFWQIVGREIRVVDYLSGFEGTLTELAAFILAKGYSLGTHYLPHDAMQTERSGSNFAAELRQAGLANLVCVPRTASVWIGINHMLELMPSIVWRQTATVDKGIEALAAYRQHIEGVGALTRAEPVHDWASHPADAIRTMAEAHRAGLFRFASAAQPRPDEYRPGGGHARKGMKPRRVST